MKKNIITVLFLIIAISGTYAAEKQNVQVVKIIDGDTIKIIYMGKKRNCRLIGIDTPESRDNNKARRDAKKTGQNIEDIIRQGKTATVYLKSIMEIDTFIYIELGEKRHDKYGRLLIYAYLLDGRMINKMIIENGYAVPMCIWPCVKYKQEFQAAYEDAIKNKRGLLK